MIGLLTIPILGTIIPNMQKKPSSISDALFSKTQQRVLGLLYGQPDRDFHTNEIIRLTMIGTGAIQRELEKLTMAGLLAVTQVGNQKRYQANHDSPLYGELRSIVLKTFGLADVLREALIPMSQQIKIAFIYGSVAKQKDTTKSDIDIMLLGNNLIYADFFQIITDAEAQLERKVNPTFYSPTDWVDKCRSENHFVTKVMQQPKIFLIGTEDELEKLR